MHNACGEDQRATMREIENPSAGGIGLDAVLGPERVLGEIDLGMPAMHVFLLGGVLVAKRNREPASVGRYREVSEFARFADCVRLVSRGVPPAIACQRRLGFRIHPMRAQPFKQCLTQASGRQDLQALPLVHFKMPPDFFERNRQYMPHH